MISERRCCRPGCENPSISDKNVRCQACHTAYMRTWRRIAKERSTRAAYNMGVEDARVAIVRDLEMCGDREFNGRTAAAIARQCVVS